MSFNIGDRVRFLHQKGEGIIRAFGKNNLVEVELTDGFSITMLLNQLVGIAREEHFAFKPESSKEEIAARATPQVLNRKGLYLAFLPVGNEQYHYYFINNTDFDFVGSLGCEAMGKYQGVWHGTLAGRSYGRTATMVTDAPRYMLKFLVRGFLYRPDENRPMPYFERKLAIVGGEFKARKVQAAPVLNQPAHLFVLDDEQAPLPENFLAALHEALIHNRKTLGETLQPLVVPQLIDLHIEKLAPEFEGLAPQLMLEKQIAAFEIAIENAIAAGMESITFIHGVGNGRLKDEIAKHCASNKKVVFYKEADRSKFGFGATLVQFK